MFPKVSGYKRGSDITKGDIMEVLVYLTTNTPCHTTLVVIPRTAFTYAWFG